MVEGQNHDDRKWGTYLILQNQFTDNNTQKKYNLDNYRE